MANFVDTMKQFKEMCDSYALCYTCPFNELIAKHHITCSMFMRRYPEEAEEAIMSWEKPIDWSNVKVDTKILVRETEKACWEKRHFAKFENGKVYAWNDGKTSFTTDNDNYITKWNFVKLAEEGETR